MENNYKICGIRIKPLLVGLVIFSLFLIVGLIIGEMIHFTESGIIGFGFFGLFIGLVFWAGISEDLEKEEKANTKNS